MSLRHLEKRASLPTRREGRVRKRNTFRCRSPVPSSGGASLSIPLEARAHRHNLGFFSLRQGAVQLADERPGYVKSKFTDSGK